MGITITTKDNQEKTFENEYPFLSAASWLSDSYLTPETIKENGKLLTISEFEEKTAEEGYKLLEKYPDFQLEDFYPEISESELSGSD